MSRLMELSGLHQDILTIAVFALGLRQFALSERKCNLANNFAINFRQILIAGESHFLMALRRQNRSNYHVFGINGKLFKNVIKWCWFRANILNICWVIQVSNHPGKKSCSFLGSFDHFYDDLSVLTDEWMNEWINE